MLSVDLVRVIIETRFNRYFRCKDVVNYVIADREGVSLKFIMDCRKKFIDPFDDGRVSLSGEVTWVLKGLEGEGYIEKYNRKMWMVVK